MEVNVPYRIQDSAPIVEQLTTENEILRQEVNRLNRKLEKELEKTAVSKQKLWLVSRTFIVPAVFCVCIGFTESFFTAVQGICLVIAAILLSIGNMIVSFLKIDQLP